MLVLKMVIYVL